MVTVTFPQEQIRPFDDVDVFERVHRLFSPSYAQKKASEFAENILNHMQPSGDNAALICLATRFINKYIGSLVLGKIAQAFDRQIGTFPLREAVAEPYLHPENRKGFAKWCGYGMPAEMYIRFPEFCNWVEKSMLLSQMKVTRDPGVRILETGEPAVWVTLAGEEESRWMGWGEIQETFNITQSDIQKEIFICHKRDRTVYIREEEPTVYTYLDNGLGLQPHHPYLTTSRDGEKITPISRLDSADFERTLNRARKFVRKGEKVDSEERAVANQERTFILQIVSPFTESGKTNLHKMLLNPNHPCIRIICPESEELCTDAGDVLEFGYWPRKFPIPVLKNVPASLRSPDKWIYRRRSAVHLTQIAITEEEAGRALLFIMNYQRRPQDPLAFHVIYQNCTAFLQMACLAAGIIVETEMNKLALFAAILPSWIQAIGRGLATAYKGVASYFNALFVRLPTSLSHPLSRLAERVANGFRSAIEGVLSFLLLPVRAMGGDFLGKSGRRMDPAAALLRDLEDHERLPPALHNPIRWFTFFSNPLNLPYVLQQWQHEQASTDTISPVPTKLTIATPKREEVV